MAQSTITHEYEGVYFKHYSQPNITCAADSVVEVNFQIPVPSGQAATGVLGWTDSTGTTGGTGVTNMYVHNIWGHAMRIDSNPIMHVDFKNRSTASTKFTANLLVCFTPAKYNP